MDSKYRIDIQGLRAISVLLVIFYHTNLIFKGGFIGVDVFFVISGYVIMTSLLNEYQSRSSISIKNFISRRIKRLLPASTIVVIFTLIASVFIFSPFSEQGQIAKTSISSAFFSANLYFILQNSYSALINNPFRHMWSLGVEEQFYVFLILSIALIIRLSSSPRSVQNRILGITISTCLISFIANLTLAAGIRILPFPTRIGFFSPLTRFWELQIGVIAAFISTKYLRHLKQSFLTEVFAASGIAVIFLSAVNLNSFTVFPGIYALGPTMGAVLVVLFAGHSKFLGSLLSSKPLWYLGDVSYSWYLWHWPLIVFCQILAPGNKPLLIISGFASLIPAALSYHFVENRFRFQGVVNSAFPLRTLMFTFTSQIFVAFLVLIGSTTTYGLVSQNPKDSRGTVLLIGDSQAGAISDGVKIAAESLDFGFAVWYLPACPVFARATVGVGNCGEFHAATKELINRLKPSVIVVANKSSLYTTSGPQGGGYVLPKIDGSIPKTYSDSIENWIGGLEEELTKPIFLNSKILLFQQVPPAPKVSPTLLKKTFANSRFDLNIVADRNELADRETALLSSVSNLRILDPSKALCPNGSCIQSLGNQSVYSDSFHISPFGAKFLAKSIEESLSSLFSD